MKEIRTKTFSIVSVNSLLLLAKICIKNHCLFLLACYENWTVLWEIERGLSQLCISHRQIPMTI